MDMMSFSFKGIFSILEQNQEKDVMLKDILENMVC